VADTGELYEWQNRGEDNCLLCGRLHGKRMTMEAWQALFLPGFHPHCDCALVRVLTAEDWLSWLFMPSAPSARFAQSGRAAQPRPRWIRPESPRLRQY